MSDEQLKRILKYIEDDLHLAPQFLVRLSAEKDAWSFVIKAHALLETALSQLLSSYLLDRRLADPVRYLPMGGKASKVSFLKATGLLSSQDETFINELGSLRNWLVHNVHNIRFDFQTYSVERPRDAARLGKAASAFGGSKEVRATLREQFSSNPRHIIWLMMLVVLTKSTRASLQTEDERKDLETQVRRLYEIL